MNAFVGTGALARVALRRDRRVLGLWIAGLSALMAMFANVMGDVFSSQAELEQTIAVFAGNPVIRAFGLASGASLGSLVMLRVFALFALLVGLMSTQAVVRHTRQNEETRRAELIGSAVIGRHASLAAALLVVAGANVLLALLIAAGLVAAGLDLGGSLAAGAALGGGGVVFAALGAVTAQVSDSSRGATGLASIGLAGAFLLSSIGNVLGSVDAGGYVVQPAWPAWLSPIGWGQMMRPYGGNEWWMLAVAATVSVALVALAFGLERRRDVGRGMMPERRGPAVASPRLLSPLGLAWRLQRGVLIGWAVGVAIIGAVFGAVSNAFEDIVQDVEQAAEFFARMGGTERLTEAFFAAIIGLMAVVIAAYTLQAVLRMRSEESEGLLEPVLATAVGRREWMLSHLAIAVTGSLVLLFLMGASAGLFAGLATGDPMGHMLTLTQASLVQGPAILVLGAIALAGIGLVPRRAGAVAWAGFTLALLTGPMIGGLLDLPAGLLNLSPFTHVPAIPAEEFEALPVLALTAAAALVGVVGIVAFERRDLALQSEGTGARFLGFVRR